jgi:hypothetical protein
MRKLSKLGRQYVWASPMQIPDTIVDTEQWNGAAASSQVLQMLVRRSFVWNATKAMVAPKDFTRV